MDNRDLKDVFITVKEKKGKDKMEKLLVYLSGVLLALVFVAVGLNFFSKQDKTVSEPDVKIVKDINQPVSAPVIPPSELPQKLPTALSEQPQNMEEVKIPSKEEKQPVQQETVKQPEPKPEEKIVHQQKEEKIQQQQKPAEIHKQTTEKQEKVTQKDKESVLSAISSGFFSIQVGAFSTSEKAMQEKSKYSNAFIIKEGGLHKVFVGRFETDREAREYKNRHNIDGFVKRLRE